MEILVGFLLGPGGSDNVFGSVFKRGGVVGSGFSETALAFVGELCYKGSSASDRSLPRPDVVKDYRELCCT